MKIAWIAAAYARDLKSLKREIAAYPDERDMWKAVPGISNTGGNLALHLAGNVRYFIGAVLGSNGYIRDRNAEFSRRDVPRAEVLTEIEAAFAAMQKGLGQITEADLGKPYAATPRWRSACSRPAWKSAPCTRSRRLRRCRII